MDTAQMELMERGLREIGVSFSPQAIQGMSLHLQLVSEWNERVNLTAIKDPRDMILKHVVDSATVLPFVGSQSGRRVLDVGTGAGFPGVVMKCLRPDLEMVLLESLNKRCRFLEEVSTRLKPILGEGVAEYKVVWGRAEDLGQSPGFRESFHLVVARAVADLRVLAEYCLPFVSVGGEFIAMKGPGAESEIEGAEHALRVLGGKVAGVARICLPEGAGDRTLVRVQKRAVTPRQYPRKAGTPTKSPL